MNPGDLTAQPTLDRLRDIQWLIYYAESRLRAILNTFGAQRFNAEARAFMSPRLAAELGWILARVGSATAMMLPLDIPILLRTLASHFESISHDPGSLQLSDDFLLQLDGGVDPDHPAALATSYSHDWWNHIGRETAPDVLSDATASACLEHHETVTGRYRSEARWDVQQVPWTVEHSAHIRNASQGFAEVYRVQRYQALRRASALFQIYEAAKRKEEATGTYDFLAGAARDAAPGALTDNDIRGLFLATDVQGEGAAEHSGYVSSLPSGSNAAGEDSPEASPPASLSDNPSDPQSTDITNVPDVTNNTLAHFTLPPLRSVQDIPQEIVSAFQHTASSAPDSASTAGDIAEAPRRGAEVPMASSGAAATRTEEDANDGGDDGHFDFESGSASGSDGGGEGDFDFHSEGDSGEDSSALRERLTTTGNIDRNSNDPSHAYDHNNRDCGDEDEPSVSDPSRGAGDNGDFNFGSDDEASGQDDDARCAPSEEDGSVEGDGDFNFGSDDEASKHDDEQSFSSEHDRSVEGDGHFCFDDSDDDETGPVGMEGVAPVEGPYTAAHFAYIPDKIID
ncbi:hypothetical protein LshimejAT787_0410910 [Lyophyllum shimeji]|uniref:Uncharacterized protein n=1 Tax=Lyophyllum shimeji TaxID=47721 RepID=A0A9P3PKN4_LYOSH|nr:hypothetical protein LshimejAT787_0410910 [Lyophyllum shimeji]